MSEKDRLVTAIEELENEVKELRAALKVKLVSDKDAAEKDKLVDDLLNENKRYQVIVERLLSEQ